jgi:transposase
VDRASVKIVTDYGGSPVSRRKSYTSEEKVRILRRHLVDRVPVSDLCDDLGLQPTVFYRWQKEFFEHGSSAFERHPNGKERIYQRRIEDLEARIKRKDGVLAELMEEHITLKKSLGEI